MRYGDFYTIIADENIFAYIRSDLNERVLIILNKSKDVQNLEIELPDIYKAEALTDLNTGEEIPLQKSSSITIDSWNWRMFVIK